MNKMLASIFALAISISILSCKKDKAESPSTYYLTCDINGVSKTFNVSTSVKAESTGGAGELVWINSSSDNLPPAEQFVIFIENEKGSVANGSYIDSSLVNYVGAYYLLANSTGYPSYTGGNYNPNTSNQETTPFTVVIASRTATEVKGTFNGEMLSHDSVDVKIHVTNGKFNLRITDHS